jgi:hypothetical protein
MFLDAGSRGFKLGRDDGNTGKRSTTDCELYKRRSKTGSPVADACEFSFSKFDLQFLY